MNHPELNAAEADVIELYGRVRPDPTLPTSASASAAASSVSSDPVEQKSDVVKDKQQPGNIYEHVDHSNEEEIRPFGKDYIGILANYLSVGLMLGGSTSILYPILVVREGVTPSLMTASTSLVTVFWSYKILFGFLSDCFPVSRRTMSLGMRMVLRLTWLSYSCSSIRHLIPCFASPSPRSLD
jgi:hypothetical protein